MAYLSFNTLNLLPYNYNLYFDLSKFGNFYHFKNKNLLEVQSWGYIKKTS